MHLNTRTTKHKHRDYHWHAYAHANFLEKHWLIRTIFVFYDWNYANLLSDRSPLTFGDHVGESLQPTQQDNVIRATFDTFQQFIS